MLPEHLCSQKIEIYFNLSLILDKPGALDKRYIAAIE